MDDLTLQWARVFVDAVTSWQLIAAGIAAIPLAIAAAWLHDHLPTRTSTTKGNHHA